VPKYKQLSAKRIWAEVKNKPEIALYFPEMRGSRVPQRDYLLNVVNTLIPNKVLQLIQRLQREKRVLVEYEPVEVVSEYAGLMDGFVTIARDQREHGLGNVTDQVRDKCCICQGDLLRNHRKRQFQCNRHRGHHSCVGSYYQRRQPGDRYLCPFKCAE